MEQKKIREIIREISYSNPKKRADIFRNVMERRQPMVLKKLSKYVQSNLVMSLNDSEIISILEKLDPNDAANILRYLPKNKQKGLIEEINSQMSSNINMLLSFEPHTAANLMNMDYILVDKEEKVSEVLEKIKEYEKNRSKFPVVLVEKKKNFLGFVPGHKLVLARKNDPIRKYTKKIATLPYNTKEKEVLKFFMKNPNTKVVILGQNQNILGIIFSDDIIRLLRRQESASLYTFAGVSQEESVFDNVDRKIKFRYKWLILNLGTCFLAAMTVGLFEKTISRNVLLAIYMPIVAGMGGNAATQTLAVMVRGMAFKQLDWRDIKRTLKNEVMAGFYNGLLIGSIVFSITMYLNRNLVISFVLGLAMVTNLVVSAIFGTLVPVVMKKLKKDPASSATIFITTATDVLGFFAFLGLAAILLR
jgi:magnesium transporter